MPNVFADLDDVFVNFRRGAAKAHGWTWDEVERRALASKTWHMGDWFDLSHEEFWAPIDLMGEIFWQSLETTPWAHALKKLVSSMGVEWYIATSPSVSPDHDARIGSYLGKIRWLDSFLKEDLHRAFISQHKHLLGNPGDILIDDSPKNIESFEARGGHGILFPLLGNRMQADRHNPIPYVKDKLCTLITSGQSS